eukprot:gene13781-16288_t
MAGAHAKLLLSCAVPGLYFVYKEENGKHVKKGPYSFEDLRKRWGANGKCFGEAGWERFKVKRCSDNQTYELADLLASLNGDSLGAGSKVAHKDSVRGYSRQTLANSDKTILLAGSATELDPSGTEDQPFDLTQAAQASEHGLVEWQKALKTCNEWSRYEQQCFHNVQSLWEGVQRIDSEQAQRKGFLEKIQYENECKRWIYEGTQERNSLRELKFWVDQRIFDEQLHIHDEVNGGSSTLGAQMARLNLEEQTRGEFNTGEVRKQEAKAQYEKQSQQYLQAGKSSAQARLHLLKLTKYKYKTIDGGEAGPYTIEELQSFLQHRYLDPKTEVFNCLKSGSKLQTIGKIMESFQWYYHTEQQGQLGPVNATTIASLLRNGVLQGDAKVYTQLREVRLVREVAQMHSKRRAPGGREGDVDATERAQGACPKPEGPTAVAMLDSEVALKLVREKLKNEVARDLKKVLLGPLLDGCLKSWIVEAKEREAARAAQREAARIAQREVERAQREAERIEREAEEARREAQRLEREADRVQQEAEEAARRLQQEAEEAARRAQRDAEEAELREAKRIQREAEEAAQAEADLTALTLHQAKPQQQ